MDVSLPLDLSSRTLLDSVVGPYQRPAPLIFFCEVSLRWYAFFFVPRDIVLLLYLHVVDTYNCIGSLYDSWATGCPPGYSVYSSFRGLRTRFRRPRKRSCFLDLRIVNLHSQPCDPIPRRGADFEWVTKNSKDLGPTNMAAIFNQFTSTIVDIDSFLGRGQPLREPPPNAIHLVVTAKRQGRQ